MSSKFMVVSYFTRDTGYEIEVKRLKKSLDRFNIVSYIRGIESLGSWDLNTRYKAKFIKEMLEFWDCPIVFLDADAEVLEYPILFDNLDCDIAVYRNKQVQLLSGTLYFGNTVNAKKLLDLWIAENKKVPLSKFEQYNLAIILNRDNEKNFKLEILPLEYCYIFDYKIKCNIPVIKHYQASRKLKKAINDKERLIVYGE